MVLAEKSTARLCSHFHWRKSRLNPPISLESLQVYTRQNPRPICLNNYVPETRHFRYLKFIELRVRNNEQDCQFYRTETFFLQCILERYVRSSKYSLTTMEKRWLFWSVSAIWTFDHCYFWTGSSPMLGHEPYLMGSQIAFTLLCT